jgi:hypothetical protein
MGRKEGQDEEEGRQNKGGVVSGGGCLRGFGMQGNRPREPQCLARGEVGGRKPSSHRVCLPVWVSLSFPILEEATIVQGGGRRVTLLNWEVLDLGRAASQPAAKDLSGPLRSARPF